METIPTPYAHEVRAGWRSLRGVMNPCEVQSVEALVQYLATNLIRHGYWYHFVGRIPPGKEPGAVDQKLVARYEANLDKFTRARRKKKGLASVAYVRLGRDFVILATDGKSVLFEEHPMHDLRCRPIRMHGYSIGAGRGHDGRFHASVRIGDETFAELADYFTSIAKHRSADHLAQEFSGLSFLPFARVRLQLLKLLRLTNGHRKASGFDPVPVGALRLRRPVLKVFPDGKTESAADPAC